MLEWYFQTLESLFNDVIYEENLEMMIDLIEEEEEIAVQASLGDYLTDDDNLDSDIDMDSDSSTSSSTSCSSPSSLSSDSLDNNLYDLDDEIGGVILEGICHGA